MNISRRFFIGSAASFGAFGGSRCFAAPVGVVSAGNPNLKFGVVSDIHITKIGEKEKMEGWGNNLTFRHTLEWFREQGVDAVMVAGDMADLGMVEELEAVADAWYKVFPDDKAPDGRKVEKLFVTGNHDFHGYLYGGHAAKVYPDMAERKKHVLRNDMGGWWRKILHEDYSRFYRKDIKGYTFLGAHWDDGTGMDANYGRSTFGVELSAFLSERGKSLNPARPFFYFQHPHPKDTCYGSWAWGRDDGKVTKALSEYPNAVAFSGHSHYSLTDERSLWQGAFTSVGTSSLRYTGLPHNARLPAGYENSGTDGRDAWKHNGVKMTPAFSNAGDCRQGMLWSVYDDRIVIQRREFLSNMVVGDDWVMPTGEAKPFAFAEHAKKLDAPEFPAGAKLKLTRIKRKNRGGKSRDGKESIPSVEKDAIRILIPAAIPVKNARVWDYKVVAETAGAEKKTRFILANGFNHGAAHKRATADSECVFALEDFPAGATVKFTVTPLNCFEKPGEPLVAEWNGPAPV